jgi:hypothetical protein
MASQRVNAFCVLRFEVSRYVITVQREFRARFRTAGSACCCWLCTVCPCKVRNKFLLNFWNCTILLCMPCVYRSVQCTEAGIRGLYAHYCPSGQKRSRGEMFVHVKASDLRYCKTVVRRFRLLFLVIVSQYESNIRHKHCSYIKN